MTDNPSSAEAIKASHGSGFLNAGFVAACVRDYACNKAIEELDLEIVKERARLDAEIAREKRRECKEHKERLTTCRGGFLMREIGRLTHGTL